MDLNSQLQASTENSDSSKTRIRGQVDHITFQNDENGYVVARLIPEDSPIPITIVGVIPGLKVGEFLEVEGTWKRHPKFGAQIEIESFKPIMPATSKGIETYLGSGLIPGLGPVLAERIVRKFKAKTIEILNTTPEKIMEVTGIGTKKGMAIIKGWKDGATIRDMMIFLQEHAISPNLATRIIRQYGENALNKLRENPYRLADDIFGVGFKKADEVARKLGVPLNDPRRLEGAIKYILTNALNDGHCFLGFNEILERGGELINLPVENVEQIVTNMVEAGDLKKDDDAIYLPAYFVSENQAAKRVGRILSEPPKQLDEARLSSYLDEEESRAGYKLNTDQRKAVVTALNSPFMILTGGPGTGKSTAMHFLVRLCERIEKRVLLASPTGRAAKRLEETTGRPASTIHRLLEYNPKFADGFMRNENNPLDGNFLIIDEASMIDLILFHNLLKAIPKGLQVLLVGDPNQLPSVGAGNVLSDLLSIREIDRIQLTQIFRQAEKSMIIVNAHRILAGMKLLSTPIRDMIHDFRFIPEDDPEEAAQKVIDIVTKKFSEQVDPIRDIQVLSPMHNGAPGAKNLNRLLQDALNPKGSEKETLEYFGRQFRIGDRVMQIKNNYEKEVFNGDIGFIDGIDRENGIVKVMFDRIVDYKSSDLDELQHAFAVTIHKSQGSEYPVVIMPILTQHFMMLRRNLLYTGITRAKRLVVIIGSQRALNIAISRDDVGCRNTNLAARIKEAIRK